MAIVWAGLAPHPPIIIESVGRSRCSEVLPTIDAMNQLAEDCLRAKPERLVLVSPHTPRPRRGIAGWSGPSVSGDFRQFGAPQARISLPVDQAWMQTFAALFSGFYDLESDPLDHGAAVPLHFLSAAGWEGETCILGLPWDYGRPLQQLAECLKAASEDGKRTALLASGDMSHCLKPEAPEGYDPRGPEFDRVFVSHLREGNYQQLFTMDEDLCRGARQDVVESTWAVLEATEYATQGRKFFSYEGPFGVGYTVAKLNQGSD